MAKSKLSIGSAIKYYRTWQGLTQAELADKLHISQMEISLYEKDRRHPSLETYVKICDVLQIDYRRLIEFKKDRKLYSKLRA